jgi:hypothetical protein
MNFAPILSFLLLWLAAPVDLTVVSLPAKGSVEVLLMPAGKAEFARVGTLSRVKIEIDRVPPASSLGAGMNAYVAWAVSPEGEFENLGEVAVLEAKLRFDGTSRFDQMALLITGEPHYMVDSPSSAVAYRNQPPREAGARRQAVVVQVGKYDYSKLQRVTPAALNIADQARTAFEIARAEGADRLSQSELRLARVALDTMDEMLNRAAPPEIILPSAHEAVRRSYRAFLFARDVAARNQIEASRAETAALGRERQELTAKLDEAARQQAATNLRIEKLEADIANLTQENRRIAQQRERDLAEFRRQQEAEKPTWVSIPEEFVDPVTSALTSTAVEALSKIVSTSELWQGPFRFQGSARVVEAVQKFFADAGISAERTVFLTR